jgi:tetratricopeptide (TPR) repeat protein
MKRLISIAVILSVFHFCSGQPAKDYYDKGYNLFNNHDFKGAIEYFSKALEIDPSIEQAYESRGTARYNLNDFKGALADFDKAAELLYSGSVEIKNPNLFSIRGLAKIALNDFTGATEDFTTAIDQSKAAEMRFFVQRANAKYFLRDYEGTVADCDIAINSSADIKTIKAEAYFWRGLAKVFSGSDMENGCLDLKKSADSGYLNANTAIKNYCLEK